jgi:glutaredoxin-like YruB-family protein
MTEIKSYKDFLEKLGSQKTFLLLYKKGSEKSDCAYKNISDGCRAIKEVQFFSADVNTVTDIHPEYNITSVPSLLEFRNGEFINIIKGCNDPEQYKALFQDNLFFAEHKNTGKLARRVVVYSTPTCSWCNTLKAYLRQNNISFTDIDVSRDQKAADELVKRSGQMGVPQTDINGEIIVGFDKPRISRLLGLNN